MKAYEHNQDEPDKDDLELLVESAEEVEEQEQRVSSLPDSVRLYLNEIGQVDRLTPEQEIELAKAIENPALLREELDNPDLSDEKRARLQRQLTRAERRAHTAREQFITANLRLVVHFAYWYTERGVPFLDLVQEGNLGLIRAVEKFDWRTGFRFSTYATWWIQQALRRATHTQERAIRLPVHVNDELAAIVRAERELVQELERQPTEVEVADRTSLSSTRIAHLRAITRPMAGLSEQVDGRTNSAGDSEITLADTIGDNSHDQAVESAETADLKMAILAAIKTLSVRESLVVILRNGFITGQELTLAQTGEEIGVSREMARQIEIKATKKLRAHPLLERYHLTEYLGSD